MNFLFMIFSFVCGQAHTWTVGGKSLPFCQRCTGLYVGIVYTLAVILLFRPRATKRCLWIHGGFLLAMLPFGYHLVDQSAVVRTISGELFAAGLGYFLVLVPADRMSTRRRFLVRSEWPYFVAISASIPLLFFFLQFGGGAVRQILAWIGFTGLVTTAGLSCMNLWLLPHAMGHSFSWTQAPRNL